jgi:membrane-associated phospholipid phosphatase
MTTHASTRRNNAHRLARLLTATFTPAHLVIGLLLLVGAASHPSPARGLAWGALAAVLVGVLPYAWVLHAVRVGMLTSRHIPDRNQRLRPIGIAAAAAIVGLASLHFLGAARQLVALVAAMLIGLVVTAAITRFWKISLHTAVVAGTATVLNIVFGPMLLIGWAVVVATGWSRVQLRDHTAAQVIAGGILGGLIAVAVFIPLR